MAGALPDQAARMIDIAHNSSLRLIHLVNDLLDMEKLVAGKMHFDFQPHALLPLIQQSIEANASFAQQFSVTYEINPDSVDARVLVDNLRLQQVLTNYLSNAAKFSPSHDTVSINVTHNLRNVRVSVADNGPGIPDEFRNRIFKKFSQADSSDTRQKGGTGLGLAICKEIIERMGGKVGFDSVPGHGSVFYFDLPPVDNALAEIINDDPGTFTRNLLILGNIDVGDNLSATAKENYHIDCARNLRSALEHLESKRFDIMVIDISFLDVNGVDIIPKIIQQQTRYENDIEIKPTIIMLGDIETGKKYFSAVAITSSVYWLAKPLADGQLESTIRDALEGVSEPDIQS